MPPSQHQQPVSRLRCKLQLTSTMTLLHLSSMVIYRYIDPRVTLCTAVMYYTLNIINTIIMVPSNRYFISAGSAPHFCDVHSVRHCSQCFVVKPYHLRGDDSH